MHDKMTADDSNCLSPRGEKAPDCRVPFSYPRVRGFHAVGKLLREAPARLQAVLPPMRCLLCPRRSVPGRPREEAPRNLPGRRERNTLSPRPGTVNAQQGVLWTGLSGRILAGFSLRSRRFPLSAEERSFLNNPVS